MAFTLIYGFLALFLLVVVAAIAYFVRGWKAALIATALTFLGVVVAFFMLVTLVTRNM